MHFTYIHLTQFIIKSYHLQFNEAADIVWELQPAANEFQYKFEVEAWNTPSTTAINF